MTRTLQGACLCRRLTFEVSDAFEYAYICHCSQCRRATGSAFKPFAGIPIDSISLQTGDQSLMKHGDTDAYDLHCKICGSLLYSVVRESTYIHVPLGVLEDSPGIRPSAHIYVGSKADWYNITDELPQYSELP